MNVKEPHYTKEVGLVMNEKNLNAHHIGIRLLKVSQGFAIVSMSIERRILNGHGIFHGGILINFADTAFSYACNFRNLISVTITAASIS